jgi:hypothetical protein
MCVGEGGRNVWGRQIWSEQRACSFSWGPAIESASRVLSPPQQVGGSSYLSDDLRVITLGGSFNDDLPAESLHSAEWNERMFIKN